MSPDAAEERERDLNMDVAMRTASTGFVVNNYPYYDPPTRGLNFPGMRAALEGLPAGAIVVLHACCHNPTGVDPTSEQWATIIETVRVRGLRW